MFQALGWACIGERRADLRVGRKPRLERRFEGTQMLRILGLSRRMGALVFAGFASLGLSSCAEDTTNADLVLSFPSDNTLRNFIAARGATSVRVWYTFDNLVTTEGDGANIIQPATAKPKFIAATSTSRATYDWSVSTGAGTGYSSGDVFTLTGLPLGQPGLKFAVEILQTLSDGLLHPVAFAYYNYGPESADPDQIKADLSLGKTFSAGRTCGSLDKAQVFTGALTESQFIAQCP